MNKDKSITVDELEELIELKYKVERLITRQFFKKVDVDNSGDLSPGELVDFRYFHIPTLSICNETSSLANCDLRVQFRHEIRRFVTDRNLKRPDDLSKSKDQNESNVEGTGEVRKQQFTSLHPSSNKN